MGTVLDMNRRHSMSRLNDNDTRWRQDVEMVREFIFKMGYAVNSAAVERVLAEKSLVPTRVSVTERQGLTRLTDHPEHILGPISSALQLRHTFCCRPPA